MNEAVETPQVEEQPAAEPVIEQAAGETPAPPQDEDAALEAEIAGEIIEVPDSSAENGKVKLVPLSAATGARREAATLKKELAAAKEGSARAQQLEARLAHLEGQLQQIGPKAQAYDAAVLAQQQQPHKPGERTPEDRAELEEIARDLDLYNTDGTPNLDRAQRIRDREERLAQRVAQQAVAPYAQHTVQTQAQVMQARAKQTLKDLEINVPDAFVEAVWNRMSPQETASPEAAKWLLAATIGAHELHTRMQNKGKAPVQRNQSGQFVAQSAEQPPAPLYSEKAGGKDPASTLPLDDKERKYIKEAGMTEAEYHAATPKWMRR